MLRPEVALIVAKFPTNKQHCLICSALSNIYLLPNNEAICAVCFEALRVLKQSSPIIRIYTIADFCSRLCNACRGKGIINIVVDIECTFCCGVGHVITLKSPIILLSKIELE